MIYASRGNVYFDLKEYARAIQDFDCALALDSEMGNIYYNRGFAYYCLKDYQQAIASFDHALASNPNDAHAYNNQGVAYFDLKEYARAIQSFDAALSLHPNDTSARYNRAIAYLWQNDIERARNDFARTWELDELDIEAGWMAAWCSMCQEFDRTAMIGRLEIVSAAAPEHYLALVSKSVIFYLRKSYRKALAELEQAIPLEPDEWDACFWKGMACAALQHDTGAVAALDQALTNGLPPVLLAPLHWLEQSRPDFYRKHAIPMLVHNDQPLIQPREMIS